MKRFCETCDYFLVMDRSTQMARGRCRRYPPVLVPATTIPVKTDQWAYPLVTASDGCGEHRPATSANQ